MRQQLVLVQEFQFLVLVVPFSSTDSVDSVEQESTDVVNEALAKLKKSICEILNISEEELDDMLQQLGLTMFDLCLEE